MKTIFALVLLLLSPISDALEISLRKSKSSQWTVTYQSLTPVKQIQFKFTPVESRNKRWQVQNPELEIVFEGASEFVRRKDLAPFTRASFLLDTSFVALPKAYAPFSPFTDGGLLIHSGRFFACSNHCEQIDHWNMSISVANGDNIILDGQVYNRTISWRDVDWGRKVYIGPSTPIESNNFLMVFDKGLPEEIQHHLTHFIPKLTEFYDANLAPIKNKTVLYASTSKTRDGTLGQKGGVLPQQMFMHWYGSDAAIQTLVVKEELSWFFSHEMAHLYQDVVGKIGAPADAWIHEGAAEFMTAKSFNHITPDLNHFVSRKRASAEKACLNYLANNTLTNAAKLGKHRAYYQCGWLIHKAIERLAAKNNHIPNTFKIWRQFQTQFSNGEPASTTTLLSLLKHQLSEQDHKTLMSIVSSQQSIDLPTIKHFLSVNQ